MPFNTLIKQFLRLVWHLNELTFLSVFTGKLPTNTVLQSLLVSRLLFIPFGFSSSSSRSGFFVFFFCLFWIQSYFSLWEHEVKICKIKWQKNIYRLFHILSNLIFASPEIHVPHGSKMNKNERNLVRCIKMVWAPPCCDVLFIEMNKKLKREFINSFPTKLSPYSIAQWFRGYSTNLKVMSTEESTLLIMFFSPC